MLSSASQITAAGFAEQVLATPDTFLVPAREIPEDGIDRFSHKATWEARFLKAGFPVPDFFAVDQEVVGRLAHQPELRQILGRLLRGAVCDLERRTGQSFDSPQDPLFVSVRTGARQVIEGLLPTVQGIGLNGQTAYVLGQKFNDPVGASRCYLRFVIQFGTVVRGLPRRVFAPVGEPAGSVKLLRKQIQAAKDIIHADRGVSFPIDPFEQLQETVLALAASWEDPAIVAYRRQNQLAASPGISIMIQHQVFGDIGESSAAGTFFSRHPRHGGLGLWGEVKFKANGDDVMTGSDRAPLPLQKLALTMPQLTGDLERVMREGERLVGGVIKGEFIIEEGAFHLLQVVIPPLWPYAILRSAVDLYEEGAISAAQAGALVTPKVWQDLTVSRYDRPPSFEDFLLIGRSAAVGIGTGEAVIDWKKALSWRDRDRKGIFLLRERPDPAYWARLFRRAAGIVSFVDQGSHFYARAGQLGVPVIVRVRHRSDRLSRIRSGQPLWLDASREDGFVSDKPLKEKKGAVARYLLGQIRPDEVLGRRAMEQVAMVQRFREIVPPVPEIVPPSRDIVEPQGYEEYMRAFQDGFPKDDPIAAAHYTLRHSRISISETFLDWLVKVGWGTSRWVEESHYTFDENGLRFLQRLYELAPDRMAADMNETTTGGHSIAVSFFKALTPPQRADLLNRMVAEGVTKSWTPGWAGGIFLASRLIAVLAEYKDLVGPEVLRLVSVKSLQRIIEECFHMTGLREGWLNLSYHPHRETLLRYVGERYVGSHQRSLIHTDRQYLQETLDRYPALAPKRWAGFIASLVDGEVLAQALQDPTPSDVAQWFRSSME